MDNTILQGLNLGEEQRHAAYQEGCDIAVLAGAGCGKTTTLVARYLYLLTCGLAPEEIVAITFTERAGQEMRSRIRNALRAYLTSHPSGARRWLEHYLALDAAPIGTIHGFCARLLKAHPAEAGLDPDFAVLDEGQSAALMAESVERTLVWAANDVQAAGCFATLGGPDGLRCIVATLLARRLEVAPALVTSGADPRVRWQAARQEWLAGILDGPSWTRALAALASLAPELPGDALDECRLGALAAVSAARRANAAGDWEGALGSLREGLRRPGGKGSRQNWGDRVEDVRRAMRALCDLYKDQVERITGASDPALDEELAAAWPGLTALFDEARRSYDALKAQRQAVDFDDLESGALRLLEGHPEVAGYHRLRCKAVLVDEFQDTNERQRRLIEALLGAPAGRAGRLLVVGDAKQSIYRFRGADVTVFRRVEQEIAQAGGSVVLLDRTHRAHAGLVEVTNGLLEGILGKEGDSARPYRVPFVALQPAQSGRPARLRPPFVEMHVGVGPTAEGGRAAAAAALASRLNRVQSEEGMAWGEVACLFRATTHFGCYEEALERARIPYVTVAGQGFYERPEVRDLLNALRALAHPTDDLAMAGLLRSPAIGLADASLYHLRWGPEERPRPLWAALQGDLSALQPGERERAARAKALVGELYQRIGRQPVAAVLKRFLDLTGYQAILRLVPQSERAGRNVDKLLADAHRSGTVGVGEFLTYVQTLKDNAAREGEAPPEAGDAVQLMSVHKAKGLEFPVVVIADAGHDGGARLPAVLAHAAWGLLVRISRAEGPEKREGLVHGLARLEEEEMQDAEERRLLYVAATRAREKLLISGHAKPAREGLSLPGWLGRLAAALGEPDLWATLPQPGERVGLSLWEGRVSCDLYGAAPEPAAVVGPPDPGGSAPAGDLPTTLARPYAAPALAQVTGLEDMPGRVWRVVPRRSSLKAPSWLVGKLVHVGLRLWRFPGDADLDGALRVAARNAGLTDGRQINGALSEAGRLLARFRQSDLCRDLEAGQRYHEVPYALQTDPAGRIDLLSHRLDGRWWLVDVKTDELRGKVDLQQKVAAYTPQLVRYRQAVVALLGQDPRLLLCFLDYQHRVEVYEVFPEQV